MLLFAVHSSVSNAGLFCKIPMFLILFQLERAADGFSVVAEYYGRGVFNKVCIPSSWLFN